MLINLIDYIVISGSNDKFHYSPYYFSLFKFNFLLDLLLRISVLFQCIAKIHFHHCNLVLNSLSLFIAHRCGCRLYGMTITEFGSCPQDVGVFSSYLHLWCRVKLDES